MAFLANAVSRRYFETMGIAIRAGRAIDATDRAESRPVAVVNEAFARRFWGDGSPWAGASGSGGADVDVVGVAADGKYEFLRPARRPVAAVHLPAVRPVARHLRDAARPNTRRPAGADPRASPRGRGCAAHGHEPVHAGVVQLGPVPAHSRGQPDPHRPRARGAEPRDHRALCRHRLRGGTAASPETPPDQFCASLFTSGKSFGFSPAIVSTAPAAPALMWSNAISTSSTECRRRRRRGRP